MVNTDRYFFSERYNYLFITVMVRFYYMYFFDWKESLLPDMLKIEILIMAMKKLLCNDSI